MSLDVVNSCSQLNAIQNPSLDEQEYKVQSNTEEKGKKQIEKKKSLKMHSKIKEPPVDREVILDAFPLKANIIKLSSLEMLSGDNDPPIGRKKSVKSRQQKEILNSSSVSNNDSELVKSKRKKSERESQSVHQSFTAESELDYMMLELTEDSNAVVCAQRSQDSTDKGLIRSRSSKGKKRKKTLQSDAGNDQSASEIFSRSDHLEASQSEEYGVTDVDSIPFFLDLADKEDRVFQPSFSEDLVGISGNSGSKLKGSRRTKDIRSELSFAFGISEETNIDDFLLNFNENYGNNDVFERKSPSEMNGYCETTEKVEKKILPRKSKNSRKSKVLHKSFEFVTNADESKVNEKSRPLSAHTVEGGPTRVSHRRSTRSPCLCLHPDNSGSSSLLPPETETQCENQRLSVESSDHQSLVSCLSANSNSYGAQKMANVSKETCIDDDYLEEEQEKKVILDEPMSVLFSHRFKEINIDEFCCSDKVQLNSDLPPESSVDAGNSAAACAYGYESSLNQPPLVDDQSVLEDSFPKKKLQRRKKSQNKLVRRKNETTDDEVGQLQELQNDCCSLQQEMAKEPIQTSFDIADDCQSKETLDPLVVNGVLDVDIENGGIEQEPFHDDGNQQTTADEMDVVVRQEFQDNKKVLSVQKEPTVLLSASEDSQTESDGDSSDSYDTAKDEILKDLLFSQSRSLFTIKEMNVEESEIGNEFTRPGAEKTMKCELVEEPDDWDDVDLTGICGKPLEKIGLTSRILGIQRNLYEEMDEEEEENEVNSSSKCLTSPSLKSFDVSPLMVEKTFTIPSLNISHGKPPPRTPNKHKRNTTKFSDNSNSDDESLVHTKDDTPSSKEPEEDSMDNTHPQQKKNNVSTGSFAETNFDDVEPVSLSYGECSLENATNNDGSVVPPSDQDALGCYEVKQDISKLSVNSDKELSPADNKQTESFPYSNKIVKATKQSKRSKERKNHILTNDVSNDDVVTMLSLKQSSEKEMEDDKKLGKENKVKEMKESTDKYPSVHALQQLKPLLDSASNDKDQAPDQGSPKKRLEVNQQTEDLEIGNELDEKNKVVANNEEDENGLSKEFSRQQMGRVSRGHQKKKAVRVPLATGSGKKPVLVFESPPDIVAKQLLIENEVDPIKSDVGNQSVTKSVSFCLSSFSEKLPSDSPDGRSHEPSGNTSRPKSDIPLPGEQKVRGKPPVPQNLEKQLINDSINKGNLPEFKVLNDNCLDDKKNMARKLPPKSISLSNQAHRTPESGSPVVPLSPEKPNDQTQVSKDSKQGLTGTFSNVRNPKFLIESSLIRQRTRTERIPKHHTLAQQSSYEDSRRRSRRSAEHNFSFERPRSADGILEARQHQPNRPRPRQPANAAISSSEAVRRKTSGNQVTGDKHVIVRDTQKTLQEAAFESITASLLDQTRQQTRRSVRSSDSSVSYFQGVYRPQALSFRSSLSHDDSRNSADFGFHQTSQSANNSWQGND